MKTLKAAVIGFLVVLVLTAVAVTVTVGMQWFGVHPRAGAVILLVGIWLIIASIVRAML